MNFLELTSQPIVPEPAINEASACLLPSCAENVDPALMDLAELEIEYALLEGASVEEALHVALQRAAFAHENNLEELKQYAFRFAAARRTRLAK